LGFWREVAMAVVGETRTAGTSDTSTALTIPSRATSAEAVNSGEALGLIAVYRAAEIISTSIMQLSLDAYREEAELKPRPLFLRQPDYDLSRAAFLEQTTLSLVLNGNAFWRVFRDNQARVTGAQVLNPNDVVINTDSLGRVTGYQHAGATLTKRDIKHLSKMRVPGDPRGRGPIQAAQLELRGNIDTRNYAARWFTKAGVPTGLLSAKQPLTAEQAQGAKDRWTETNGGERGVAVLGSDFSYQAVYLSPEAAQFIQGQQYNTTAVARLFGIPAGLMLAAVEGSSMTYSNVSQSWAEFQKFTLSRYTVEIETAFTDLMPRGTDVKFNYEGLLRPDVISRYAMHAQAMAAGWITADEVRRIENLPPLPGGLGATPTTSTPPTEDTP
jgi:HK97 family phage portal protein